MINWKLLKVNNQQNVLKDIHRSFCEQQRINRLLTKAIFSFEAGYENNKKKGKNSKSKELFRIEI